MRCMEVRSWADKLEGDVSNAPDFIVHNEGDTVGVVVVENAAAGQELTGWVMATDRTIRLAALAEIPLGHKVAVEAHKVDDLMDSQPTKGNKFGGLSTIEEKAFGNLEKIGHKVRYIDVLAPAEEPGKGPGLYYMDTSSAAAECCTLQAAAGFVVHMFPTGQGNVIGNPIMPVVKISGNPRTVRTMSEHIDVDVTGILRREMTIDQAGKALIDMVVRTCNGRVTAAEALRYREFVMTKLYRSA
jgi:(2R)-sulfolactate sulfo-lyase subunit beta